MRPLHLASAALLALSGLGCPKLNSRPCSEDEDCPQGRCRRGACGPFCLEDAECGSEQVCTQGQCRPRPECSADQDCARGFFCEAGECRCSSDSSCAKNQLCQSGRCQQRPRCQSDQDCGSGRLCELTQGLCLPPCQLSTDCAPDLDARLSSVLYSCQEGRCLRRCLSDEMCGQGLVCEGGSCAGGGCKTQADCPRGQYCTSESQGRCREYRSCSQSSQCPPNQQCRPFPPGECPPGLDCAQSACQELPRCRLDSDCGSPTAPQQAYCQDGHCQPTTGCSSSAPCPEGRQCIGSLCLPSVCRGHPDCPAGACVEGRCASAPAPAEVTRLSIHPRRGILRAGDSIKLTLVAYRQDGSSFPLSSASFAVLDWQGNPSGAAQADSSGRITALAPGAFTVLGSLPGSRAVPRDASLLIYPAISSGRRVVAIDAATGSPLPGVRVLGCDAPPPQGPCPAPLEVPTGSDGQALFPTFQGPSASFSLASPEIRGDGYPRYDRLSVLTSARDLLLPLGENPVHGAAGFNASIAFSGVRSRGDLSLGYAVLSAGDLSELDLRTLLGETFLISLPPLGLTMPAPGSVVLSTTSFLGNQEVKERSLGLGQAGLRSMVAFAGRTELNAIGTVGSLEFLAHTGGLDYAVQAEVEVSHRPKVADIADLDHDGLCSQEQKCPLGTEELPDYSSFRQLAFRPEREQARRTEVVVPNLPDSLDTVVVSAVELAPGQGALPLGFSSRVADPAGPDGTRPVPPILLRSGAPYGGVEVGQPGVWALATSSLGGGIGSRASLTVRLSRGPTLPLKVWLGPFLPIPSGSSYDPASRTLSPGQPAWSSISSMGGELARAVIVGARGRHLLYFHLQPEQTAVRVPEGPAGEVDPASQAGAGLELTAIDLSAPVGAEEALDLAGPNLWNLGLILEGFSRFVR